jgi:hypothetical protein
MADLKELADEAAKELLKAIRDQARKASDLKLLPACAGVFARRFGGDHRRAGGRGRGGACSNLASSHHSGLETPVGPATLPNFSTA